MTCDKCGNHEFIEKCKTCNNCEQQHMMVFGIDWGKQTNKPCPHQCSFTMPNNNEIKYNCTLLSGHSGQCNFGVNTASLSRMAKDMRG